MSWRAPDACSTQTRLISQIRAGPLAQRSELSAHNRLVLGSNPRGPIRCNYLSSLMNHPPADHRRWRLFDASAPPAHQNFSLRGDLGPIWATKKREFVERTAPMSPTSR